MMRLRKMLAILAVALTPVALHAQQAFAPFQDGFIGATGQNPGKVNDIITFDSLGIAGAHFTQPSTDGLFGGTQGNDLAGVLRLTMKNGQEIAIPGALNWRITTQGNIETFGFIPDPLNPVQTLPFAGGTYVLDATRNYGAIPLNRTVTYLDGASLSGNAARSKLIEDLNAYLAELGNRAPIVTTPAGATNQGQRLLETILVSEGEASVGFFAANEPVTWTMFGGPDFSLFSMDQVTGELRFVAPPSHAAPLDEGADNDYQVTLRGTNALGFFTDVELTVRVFPLPDIAVSRELKIIAESVLDFDCASGEIDPDARFLVSGACVSYRLMLSSADNGSLPAQDMQVADLLPGGLTFVATHSSVGFSSVQEIDGSVLGIINNLPPGGVAEVVLRATLD